MKNEKSDKMNFCISGVMSRCGAGTTWEEQKRCKYAKQSSVSRRCMYYIESIDGHCDCLEAQADIKGLDK